MALVVLGFLLAAVGQGIQFGLRTAETQGRQAAAQGDVEAVDRLLRRLIEHADPGAGGNGNDAPGFLGTRATLALTTAMHDAPTDAALLVEGGRLVLRTTPHRHAVPLVARPPPATDVLLDGVQRVEFAYWGATKPGAAGSWLTSWPGRDPPALVRIHLVMAAGRPRWPDIVAATVLRRGSG